MIKKLKAYKICAGIIILTVTYIGVSEARYIEPGSKEDPIVTKNYVDNKIKEVKSYIDLKLKDNNQSGVSSQSNEFKILELEKGKRIICKEGTEIVARSGIVKAIGSKLGGLLDITEGSDLPTGERLKQNHLIIIPRSDGRGVEIHSDNTFIMIKGDYTIY